MAKYFTSSSSCDSLNETMDEIMDVDMSSEDELSKDVDNLLKSISKRCQTQVNPNSKNTINILLLGETGVGKSTFINGFANYITYETLEEAKEEEILSLIPSSFTVTNPKTYEQKIVYFGRDINESDKPGASATQGCKSYLFPFADRVVRLIDTPGVCDVRGLSQDRVNFENILDYISQYEDLHCICILLKPNNARITVTFEFCIKQLLSHLQKSASHNIVFLFTNARSTFYRPGDTAPALRKLLNTIKTTPPYVDIAMKKETIYCVDNESFRFLVALKNGVVFESEDLDNFSESWKITANECLRLMKYIIGTNDGQSGLTAHRVQDTISVNEARRLIDRLCQPLADILLNIADNFKLILSHKNEIRAEKNNINKLKDKLYVPHLDMQVQKLDHPKTVCADPKCCEEYKAGNAIKYIYKTVCHNPCHLTSIQKEVIGDPGLAYCQVFKGDICGHCGCDYRKHLHIYYDSQLIETQIMTSNVTDQIKGKKAIKAEVEKTIEGIEERCNQLKYESVVIIKTTAKFSHFLKCNAITPYKDSFITYVRHLIQNEESLSKKGSKNVAILRSLKQVLIDYEKEKNILEKYRKDKNVECMVSAQDVFDSVQELYQQKLFGHKIQQSMDIQSDSRKDEQTLKARETVLTSKTVRGFGSRVRSWLPSLPSLPSMPTFRNLFSSKK